MPRYVTLRPMANRRRITKGRSGPPEAEWELHKRTIINLYTTTFLEDVRSEMERLYGFRATKRMYDTHFRKWNVSKIIKSARKEEIIQQVRQGDVSLEYLSVQYSPATQKKVMRYWRSVKRQEQQPDTSPVTTNNPLDDGADLEATHIERTPSEGDGDDTNLRSTSLGENLATPISNNSGSAWTPSNSIYSSSQALSTEGCSPAVVSPLPTLEYHLAHNSAYRVHENIVYLVRTYYSVRVDSLNPDACSQDVLLIGTSYASKRFWNNVKNGIYLWKISAPQTGFNDDKRHSIRALREAGTFADAMLEGEPLDFMCEVLSTLSPTNVSVNPSLRRLILKYLAETVTKRLPPTHPVPGLCVALLNDTENAFVSYNGLLALLDFFQDRLGPCHCSTSAIMNKLITQMRRSENLQEVLCARQLAENAVRQAAETKGIESNETRKTAVELAHVLTKLGKHGRTLSLRMQVVTKPLKHGPETYREDSIAAHTMEDIAEYYVRFGFHEEAVEWLRRARDIAIKVWGADEVSTLHIIDKMEKLQCGDLSGQVINKGL